MPGNWNDGKIRHYKRDILRDYCLACATLDEQFERFRASGTLSFSIMQGVMGDQFNKGLLWRLKDTAHHLFGGGGNSTAGEALDWAIGFLFHECAIILEASYQLQKYYPSAGAMLMRAEGRNISSNPEALELVRRFLFDQATDTRETLAKMVERASGMLTAINRLFCHYLAGEADNRPLARLVYDREELLRSVFKELYPYFMRAVFGDAPEKGLLEAAWSLFESGRRPKAERAARKALEVNPNCREAQELLDKMAAMG